MSLKDELVLVLDTGSRYTKAGFASEHSPRAVFPTTIGRFRHQGLLASGCPDIFFGQEAIQNRGISNLTWPVQGGLIKNWDDIEKIWFHTFFKELHVPPESTWILHVVHPLIATGDREKMAEILFESFAISGLNLMKAPILALHASGRTTGVVYENGAGSSYVCSIFEGFPLQHTIAECELTGEALTDRLQEMFAAIGYSFTTPLERELVEGIKAKLCYVASNYTEECDKYSASGENQIKYDLPDGQQIYIGQERFKSAEVLFQPSIAGLSCPSVSEYICNSIQKCDTDIRQTMYQNVVLSGGATQYPGFGSRLFFDIIAQMRHLPVDINKKIKIDELPSRQFAPWIGGSIVASMDTLKGFWMTKQEYEDIGPDRVNYKFY